MPPPPAVQQRHLDIAKRIALVILHLFTCATHRRFSRSRRHRGPAMQLCAAAVAAQQPLAALQLQCRARRPSQALHGSSSSGSSSSSSLRCRLGFSSGRRQQQQRLVIVATYPEPETEKERSPIDYPQVPPASQPPLPPPSLCCLACLTLKPIGRPTQSRLVRCTSGRPCAGMDHAAAQPPPRHFPRV